MTKNQKKSNIYIEDVYLQIADDSLSAKWFVKYWKGNEKFIKCFDTRCEAHKFEQELRCSNQIL